MMEQVKEKPREWSSGVKTKDSEGKLFYELDWEFIEGLAQRMEIGKQSGKYARFEWEKYGVPVTEMNHALIRHLVAILKGELDDEGQKFGHYYALGANSMMIVNTLKKLEKEKKAPSSTWFEGPTKL